MRVLVFLSVFLAAAMQQVQAEGAPDPGWVSVGTLPTWFHDVSGEFYIVDDKTAMILNFTYDGNGPGAFLYFYPWSFENVREYEPGGGVKIPVVNTTESDGSFVPGVPYNKETLQIELPPEWSMCDFAWFSIWCEDFNQTFSAIEFQPAYFATNASSAVSGTSVYCFPTSIAENRWIDVGEMMELAHGVTGNLYLLDQSTFIIVNFNYDGLGPAAYLYFYDLSYADVDRFGGGVQIYIDGMPSFEVGRSFENELFVIHLPDDWNACDFAWFTIWCKDFNQTFTEVEIDPGLFATVRSSVVADTLYCYPASVGEDRWVFVGEMTELAHGVTGLLYLLDRKTFVIVNFNYDGLGPAAFLYFYDTTFAEPNRFGGGVKIDLADGMSKFEVGVSFAYDDASFVIRLPDEYDACDFAWFTIWCEDFNQTFTEVEIDPAIFVPTDGDVTMGMTIQCEVPPTPTPTPTPTPGSGVTSTASLLTIAVLALVTRIFA